ncbi:MAG TPA: methyltransferase domain-containing protein [Candidatus Eisenbacteria bacterium]|nr:methyltransferase domain-containing protein [Candidatus Eisenbacteria bacterium]
MSEHPAYRTYWQRKEMLRQGMPQFPVRRWWETDGLSEIEQVYFDAVRNASSLLDVGAGDLRIMRKFQAAGFAGDYHTQDIGGEGSYTYGDLSQVTRRYEAILCLDVVEHLTLVEGLTLVDRMVELLEPGGALVLQTANAYYIPNALAWDMTHLHVYNLPDLHAYLVCDGLDVAGYRVVLGDRSPGVVRRVKIGIAAYVKQKILGCDFANNIALVARRPR